MKDTLVHMSSKAALFKEIRRVLKEKGEAIIVSSIPKSKYWPFFICQVGGREYAWELHSYDSYKGVVGQMLKIPTIEHVSPPYFYCDRSSTIKAARRCGLTVVKCWKWTPPEEEPDWYEDRRSRFVLHLVKNN